MSLIASYYRECPFCRSIFGRGKGLNNLARHMCDEPVVIELRKEVETLRQRIAQLEKRRDHRDRPAGHDDGTQ